MIEDNKTEEFKTEELKEKENDIIEMLNKANERLSMIRQAIAQQEAQMNVGGAENEK